MQDWVPLPAGSNAGGATQAANSEKYPAAGTAASTAATPDESAPAGATANGAPDGAAASAPNTGGATAGARNASGATAADGAAADMRAPAAAAASVSTPAATAAMPASAAAATAAACELYASAERRVFFIEDMKGRQTDVGDFLLAENKSPRIVPRWISCGRRGGRRSTARHHQRNAGCPECQGRLATLPYGTSPRLRHEILPSAASTYRPEVAFAFSTAVNGYITMRRSGVLFVATVCLNSERGNSTSVEDSKLRVR